MRKNILNTIILAMFSLTLISCNDYLSNKPKGYSIPEYYDDYAVLLNGMSLPFLGVNYPALLTDDIVIGGAEGVPASASITSKQEYEQRSYTFKKGDLFPEGSNDSFYADAYKSMYTYNVVINNILNVPDGVEEDKHKLRAEALTHRAFTYLQLVNVYAKHYDKNSAATDYGVPIILTEDINSTYERNTVQEVYNLILADLKEAVLYLADATNNSFHPNKTTAYGLLARTYLYMGEYELALESAKTALKLNKTNALIDYKKYHAMPEGYWDRIVDNEGKVFPQRGENIENLFIKLPPNDMSSEYFASDDLLSLFPKNLPNGAIDKRFEMFYAKDRANTREDMLFPGYTMYIAHVMPNLGVTLQEIYLTLAECEARIVAGTATQATAYLDILRNNRIVNNKPLVAVSKDDALCMALDERRKEMAFWGQMRYIDLKRLNKEEKFAKTIVHTLEGKTYTLPANDNRWIMPLPHSVREFNPSIPQYER
ncbi:MAG: RagB/SusD family nutrient uptake outer membrane protein [Bacteroidales bacterium]